MKLNLRFCVLYGMLISAATFSAKAQTPTTFVIDTTSADAAVPIIIPAPGNKQVLIKSPSSGNFTATIMDSVGNMLNTFNFTSLLTFQNSNHASTEINAVTTADGNIFISYTSPTSDNLLNQNAAYILVNQSGTLLHSGTLNTTNPGAILNRFIQLVRLSNGKIAAVWQRSDNTGYACRIFNSDGTASSPADIPLAGPGSANTFGGASIYNVLASASSSGGFMVTLWYYNGPIKAIRLDNTGTIQAVTDLQGLDGSGNFNNYVNYGNVSLANGNYLETWARNGLTFYSIISNTGTVLVDAHPLVYPVGTSFGEATPVNTTGSQGFVFLTYKMQEANNYYNPYYNVSLSKYNLSGDSLSTTQAVSYIISPSAYLFSGDTKGYGLIYSYYKSYVVDSFDGAYGTGDNDIKGLIYDFGNGAPLPLTLVDFTGKANSEGNVLQWQTANEAGVKLFVIEKSADAKIFNDLVAVNAVGIDGHNYQYTDIQKNPVGAYYRLKILDVDGSSTLSKVVWIASANAGSGQLTVYPNPVTSNAILEMNGNPDVAGSKGLLYNAAGSLVKSFTIYSGSNVIQMEGLASGTYLLRLANGQTLKLVKK